MAARDRSRSPPRSSGIKIADQKIVFIGTSTRFDLGQKYCGVNNGLFKCKERIKELGGEVVGTVASGRKIIPKDEKMIERADIVVKMSNFADVDLQKAESEQKSVVDQEDTLRAFHGRALRVNGAETLRLRLPSYRAAAQSTRCRMETRSSGGT
eukprot:s367_g3.t1